MKRETVFVGARFHVDRFALEGRDGTVTERELVVHPGAVVVLARLDDGRVVLIRNHRTMLGRTLLELPAGTLEPGEIPAEAAARELAEETGYVATSVVPMLEFFASPGITDERMFAFRARGLVRTEPRLDATEQIEVELLTMDAALARCRDGSIEDGKTLALLLFEASTNADA